MRQYKGRNAKEEKQRTATDTSTHRRYLFCLLTCRASMDWQHHHAFSAGKFVGFPVMASALHSWWVLTIFWGFRYVMLALGLI